MSTATNVILPGYPTPSSHIHSPTYTAAPQAHEYRIAYNARLNPNRSPLEFVKQAKNGGVSLRLSGQDDQVTLPVYGYGASVEGTLDVHKRDGITSVEIQVSGLLARRIGVYSDTFPLLDRRHPHDGRNGRRRNDELQTVSQ